MVGDFLCTYLHLETIIDSRPIGLEQALFINELKSKAS